jgi:hypothetical protein
MTPNQGPIPDSYWVVPGCLLAGEYPGSESNKGPTELWILPEHYPDGNLPPRIIGSFTNSLLWCDQAGEDFEPYGRPLPVWESGQVCPGRQTP